MFAHRLLIIGGVFGLVPLGLSAPLNDIGHIQEIARVFHRGQAVDRTDLLEDVESSGSPVPTQ